MTEHFDFKGINLIKSFYCTVPTNNWGIAWIKCIQHFLILYRTYSGVVSRSTDLYFCILISLLPFHIFVFPALNENVLGWVRDLLIWWHHWEHGVWFNSKRGTTLYKAEALFTSLNSMQYTCSGGNETTVFCEKPRRWGIKNKAKEDRSTKKLHPMMLVFPVHAIWLQILLIMF